MGSLKAAHGLRVGEMETSQKARKGRGSKIENANCRRRGAEGSIFAGLLPSRVDYRRGRKFCDKRGRSLPICRVVFKQGGLGEGSPLLVERGHRRHI